MKLSHIIEKLNINYSLNQKDDIDIVGLNTLEKAKINEISFLENSKYLSDLKNTKAAAVFIKKYFINDIPLNSIALICDEPYVNLAHSSSFFKYPLIKTSGSKPNIGSNTQIMSNVHLGKDVIIGNNCTIMSGSFIGDGVVIGSNTIIYANVTIYTNCKVGDNCIIHSGTVIGSDGFGFATNKIGKHIKIYQNGNVIIQNDVELGANCTIDRAVFNSTIIKTGTKIDNLVHIAHNCQIGEYTLLAGQVGIAGSTNLCKRVIIGGQSGVSGHLNISSNTIITSRAGITKNIKNGGIWSGFPMFEHTKWLKLQAKISKLLK